MPKVDFVHITAGCHEDAFNKLVDGADKRIREERENPHAGYLCRNAHECRDTGWRYDWNAEPRLVGRCNLCMMREMTEKARAERDKAEAALKPEGTAL